MIIVSHPTVNAFNRALVEALADEGRLAAFHTTIACGRRTVRVPPQRLVQHRWRELGRLAAQRLGLRAWSSSSWSPLSVDAVYRDLDRKVAAELNDADAVYAYEDGALHTFRVARQRGVRRIYELPIAYFETVRQLLAEEALRLPEWAPTLGALTDRDEKLAAKAEELRLAELVICPSRFVQRSLPPRVRSIVAEFGSPAVTQEERRPSKGALRVLFAGAMTQRKGLADVFYAFQLLRRDDVELIVMGAPLAPMTFYRSEWPHFCHEAPRSNPEVLQLMRACDVLVLPSIVEGRALVQQEALSQGLPLIVTANAGGEDLISPGETGWLVPIRSPQAIAERVAWCADHREMLQDMRAACRRMAATRTWAAYTGTIISAIEQIRREND